MAICYSSAIRTTQLQKRDRKMPEHWRPVPETVHHEQVKVTDYVVRAADPAKRAKMQHETRDDVSKPTV
jgi:hypothetical protein